MKGTPKTNRIVPAKAGEHSRQPAPTAAPPICYRMEPLKRMLARADCGNGCQVQEQVQEPDQEPGQESVRGNHMPPCLMCTQEHTVVDLERISRVALMITPEASGDVVDQAWEALSTIRAILKQQARPMTVTSQTVFLRRAEDARPCRRLFEAYFGDRTPATNFVVQSPSGGQALAIEAWALSSDEADIRFTQPGVVSVAYDGLRWVHVAGITPPESAKSAHAQSQQAFAEMARRLEAVDASFHDVVRTWIYQGGITEVEQGVERYRELNRARTEFFEHQESLGRMQILRDGSAFYPASTGIGTAGRGLAISCLALQTDRQDVRLLPLENPRQTSAFHYAQRFSNKSPKFSRAMAVVIGDYATTWISGTASIVDSESVHLGDVQKQTEQTIDNIENLISAENFKRHGCFGVGAELEDLAKVRVYIKRPDDFEKCREVCRRRFGPLPTIYALADVCRSELLVEIEGVAFSRRS